MTSEESKPATFANETASEAPEPSKTPVTVDLNASVIELPKPNVSPKSVEVIDLEENDEGEKTFEVIDLDDPTESASKSVKLEAPKSSAAVSTSSTAASAGSSKSSASSMPKKELNGVSKTRIGQGQQKHGGSFKIFVKNVPSSDVTTDEVIELFNPYGPVTHCSVYTNNYAFVVHF